MKYFYEYLLLPAIVAAMLMVGVQSPVTAATYQTKEAEKQEEEDKEEPRDQDGLTIADRLEIFREVGQDEGPEAALDELRGIQEDFPKNMQIGATLLSLTQQMGMNNSREERESANELFYESGKLARKLVKLDDFPVAMYNLAGTAIYNEACTLALDGKDEEAMKILAESFKYGFDDFDHALQDSDFGDLLETDEYKKIVKEGRKSNKKLQESIKQKAIANVLKSMDEFESFEFDFSVENTDGDAIDKSTFEGELLIVDIWGTWCPPCKEEIPSFIKLKKKYKGKLEIVGLAYERGDDEEEKMEKVAEYMEEHDMNYPCALCDDDIKDQIENFRGYPTTLFIDKEGEVKMTLVGLQSYEVLEAVAKKIMDEKE